MTAIISLNPNQYRCLVFVAAVAACASTLFLIGGDRACAQDNVAQLARHPASQVVQSYLRLAISRKWKASAALIEPESLVTLRDSYARRIVRPGTTVEQEEAMVRKLGKTTPEEVAKMPPVEFYAAYNTALQQRYDVTDEVLKLIASTLKLRLLSIALEGETLAHVLVRTSHRDHRNYVSNLELISLKKVKGKWMVALNEQDPIVTPLDEIDPVVRKPLPLKKP